MIKPVTKFDAYFLKKENSKLYGIDIQGVKEIEVIDQDGDLVTLTDFFTKAGVLYFAVNEIETVEIDGQTISETVSKFYSQKDGVISEISSLPEKPVLNRSHYSSPEFSIADFDYKGKACTDVKNLVITSGIERFFMVDGFCHFEGIGLYINVSDGRYNETHRVRESGLYFWPSNDSNIVYMLNEGVMWK